MLIFDHNYLRFFFLCIFCYLEEFYKAQKSQKRIHRPESAKTQNLHILAILHAKCTQEIKKKNFEKYEVPAF